MKNAILLHGSSGTPDGFWLPSIKKYLENNGYEAWAPQLPKPEAPDLKIQLPFVLGNGKFNNETIIVAHSAACPLTLSILENINVKIKKVILVSGYARPLGKMEDESLKKLEAAAEPILQKTYNWEKIKNNVEKIVFINSDNDPWGCDDKEGQYMHEHLGGELIINHEGHMGSDRFNQPYKDFPFLEKYLLD